MAGLVFMVCVPTSEHEITLMENAKRKSASSNSVSNDLLQQFANIKPNTPNSSTNVEWIYENPQKDSIYCSSEPKTPKDLCPPVRTINKSSRRNSFNDMVNTGSYNDTQMNKSQLNVKNSDRDEYCLKEEKTDKVLPREEQSENVMGDSVDKHLCYYNEEMPMEKVLERVLKKFKIENAVWCAGESSQHFQVFFSANSGDHCEEILRLLNESGIGVKLNSVVSVIPCTLYYQGKDQTSTLEDSPAIETIKECRRKSSSKTSAWEKFMLSVRARLTVAQVVEGVKADANLTFDFLVLLLISAFVAALGLVENNTVILVASMLISPLMGPIMAGTFGTVIGDRHLQKMGVFNELFGLLVCLIVGYFFGLVAGLANEHWGNAGWPTDEMILRGQIRSLWVGILIAFASGAAVAIAILGDNTGSLVGVAISASLMPPAVNAGLLWALACMDLLWKGRMQLEDDDDDDNNSAKLYSPIYSDNPPVELAILGGISLCLTLINIVCIFLAGITVLKIKEVAPRTSKDHQQFWKHDIKIARDYNRTLSGEDAEHIQKRLADEIACSEFQSNLNRISPNVYKRLQTLSSRSSYLRAQDIFNMPGLNAYYNQQTWSPSTTTILNEKHPTLHELVNLYTTLSPNNDQGTLGVQPLHTRKRRHSGGISWIGGPQGNDAHIPAWSRPVNSNQPGSGIPGLPTINERLSSQHWSEMSNSEPSLCSLSSIPGQPQQQRPINFSETESSAKKRFTVTAAQDPLLEME